MKILGLGQTCAGSGNALGALEGGYIWADMYGSIQIDGDCKGDIILEGMPSENQVWIGGRLGLTNVCINPAVVRPARIVFKNTVTSQVIIGGLGTRDPGDEWWTGEVYNGPLTAPWDMLSSSQEQPHEAPYYDLGHTALGGGSVGEVPFHLHAKDCEPAADAGEEDRTFLNSAFCHVPYGWSLCPESPAGEPYDFASIMLEFYGPIKTQSVEPGVRPYQIGVEDASGDPDWTTDYAPWTAFEIVADPPGGAARRLVIHGTEFTRLLEAHYFIRPKIDVTGENLLCADLASSTPVPVWSFLYDFWLTKDCNTNGVPDREEGDDFCCLAWPCDPDVNGDGNADQDDVSYLSTVIAGGSNPSGRDPDFNRDGNVDQDDLQALVNVIGGGECP